ncbi:MAG: TMEM175 family protein [Xanthomonadales bacterium]|nr:TMEM175 family protein [Xanthomonadales bacterium]
MNLSAEKLAELPVDSDGFRQRGMDMTRIETFTDAAFAFALTLLVISFDEVPRSIDDLIAALKNVPAFAASFAQICMFWYAHHAWSRRYGLDDLPTVLLSLLFVFVTLVYVFPLRLVFSALFAWITGGWLPFEMTEFTTDVIGDIFVVYGVGFVAMSAVLILLYTHALRRSDQLMLDPRERFTTVSEIQAWLIVAGVGLTSTIVALLPIGHLRPVAGMVYALLSIIMPLFATVKARQARRLLQDA